MKMTLDNWNISSLIIINIITGREAGPPKKHGSHSATEIIPPHISSWQSGIIKTALIQQIAHAAFDPLGVRQHFPCDSNF